MSDTPATPQPKQWKEVKWPDRTVLYEILFGGEKLTVYNNPDNIDGKKWGVDSVLGFWSLPPTATTTEQAVAEAVVTLSQHLDWLREELAAIPLTLPTT